MKIQYIILKNIIFESRDYSVVSY